MTSRHLPQIAQQLKDDNVRSLSAPGARGPGAEAGPQFTVDPQTRSVALRPKGSQQALEYLGARAPVALEKLHCSHVASRSCLPGRFSLPHGR